MVPPCTGNVVKGCIAFCAKASGHPVTESCRAVITIPHHANKCSNTTRRAAQAECTSPALPPTGGQWRRVVVLPQRLESGISIWSHSTFHTTRGSSPRQVLRPPSYRPVWAAVDPWTGSDHTHGRTPPPTVARIHVHARSKSRTTGLQAHQRPPAFVLASSNCTPASTHPPVPGNIRAAETARTKRAPPAVIGRKRPRFLTNRQPAILRRRPANTHRSGMHRIEIISHHTQHLRGAQAE